MLLRKITLPKQLTILFLLPLFLHTKAQTGPGGVGSSANNALWLVAHGNSYTNAGATLGTDGSTIQQWNDISGNNRHATQTTSGYKPVLKTNQANGFSALRFDGSDDRILAEDIRTANKATVFVVVKHIAILAGLLDPPVGILQSSPNGLHFSTNDDDQSIAIWTKGFYKTIFGRGVQSGGTVRDLPAQSLPPGLIAGLLTANPFFITSQHYDGTNIKQYINGDAPSSITYDGTLKNWQDFGIGRAGTQSLDGDIAEVIVYDTSLNAAQRIIVQNYLAAKYGLDLAANDLYDQDNVANGNYDFEVAGIGRQDATNEHTNAKGTGMVRVLNATDLGNNEYFIWGHNNQPATTTATDVPSGIVTRLNRVWRVSETGNVGNVTMQFDLSSLGSGIDAATLRLLVDNDANTAFASSTIISGATALGNDIFEFAGVSDIGDNTRYTVGFANSLLPVTFIHVEAKEKEEGQITVSWTTAFEQDSHYFIVQRSKNGIYWENVQQVKGAGNTAVQKSYTVVDDKPYTGKSLYRIMHAGLNGQTYYSNNREVFVAGKPFNHFYPNPAINQITIQGNELRAGELKMYDVKGRNINPFVKLLKTSAREMVLDISGLMPGMYIFKIQNSVYRVYKAK